MKQITVAPGLAAAIIAAFIMTLCTHNPAAAQPGYPDHDCCDYECPGNHQAETAIPGGGCVNLDPEQYFYCMHQYGPATWVLISSDSWWCDIEGFGNVEGCGIIWCSNGKGGYSTRGVSIAGCAGKLQAAADGIICYSDNNDNDRYDLGDSIFQRTGC